MGKKARGVTERGGSLVVSFSTREKAKSGKTKMARRSVGQISVKEALEKRAIFQNQVREGEYQPPSKQQRPRKPVTYTVGDLLEPYMTDFSNRGGKDPRRWRLAWKWLEPFFGSTPIAEVTTAQINDYVAARKTLGKSNGTINRETTLLKAMLNFGAEQTPVMCERMPKFPSRLKEAPPRRGFVDYEQYAVLCSNCRELWLRTLLAICYSFGLRKGEALNLRVRQVDLLNRWLVLEADQTKTGEPRRAALTGETYELLKACVAGKSADDFVVTHPDSSPVRDPRKAWFRLIKESGCVGLLIHDLRRSAVRNLVRAGNSEAVAMKISGHATRSVFDRYNVVDERDLVRASRLLEKASRQAASRNGGKTDTKHAHAVFAHS